MLEVITSTIRDELDDDTVMLTPETSASDVEGWDSLAHVRIMVAIEERFGVHFSNSEITSMKNVGELIALIESKR